MLMKLVLVALVLTGYPSFVVANNSLREETCLLGMETATLFFAALSENPERADKIIQYVNTKISRRAYYWAMIYIEQEKTEAELSADYLRVCRRIGASDMPAPVIDK